MTDADNIILRVKKLDLPEGQYMVTGSAILQILGIRAAQDIDLLVSPELFKELKEKRGWPVHPKYPSSIDNEDKTAGAKQSLDFMKQNYTLDEALKLAYWYEGIPFMGLELLIDAKTQLGREKDLKDIELIKEYLAKKI
jgi:predicted nucleic acid-binding protein